MYEDRTNGKNSINNEIKFGKVQESLLLKNIQYQISLIYS